MKNMARAIQWFDTALLKGTLFLCGAILTTMVAVAGLGVIFRFALHASLSWSEELDAYLFVWLTFLGAAAGIQMRVHPEVRALVDGLSPDKQRWLIRLADVAIMALGTIFSLYGGEMITLMGTETAASLPVSMAYPYLAIPIGGALLIAHAAAHLLLSYLAPCTMEEATGAPRRALAQE